MVKLIKHNVDRRAKLVPLAECPLRFRRNIRLSLLLPARIANHFEYSLYNILSNFHHQYVMINTMKNSLSQCLLRYFSLDVFLSFAYSLMCTFLGLNP